MRSRLALAVLAALAADAGAADSSIRCDRGIVSVGDSKLDLLAKCGAPALRDVREVELGRLVARQGEVVTTHGRRVAAEVEEWTYDFGPLRFTQLVTLEGGKVTAVERGGYGYAQEGARPAPGIPVTRCDPSVLQEGATKLDLLARCGPPAAIDRQTVERTVAREEGGRVVLVSATVEVELWSYNFGPLRFLRLATLEGSRVVRVESGGYGYPE